MKNDINDIDLFKKGSRIPVPPGQDSARAITSISSRIPTINNNQITTPARMLGVQSSGYGIGGITSSAASRVAHSQPGSRSTSPTPKYSYLTHLNNANNINSNNIINNASTLTNSNRLGMSAASSMVKSKIPTSSRNSSRESSPGRRSNYGIDRRSSFSKASGRRLFNSKQLINSTDSEQAIANAMSNKYVSLITL
jgi:hypothetical protein